MLFVFSSILTIFVVNNLLPNYRQLFYLKQKNKMSNKFIACCGLDCETCDARIATINNDDNLRKEVSKRWCELNNTDQITPETINCTGCRIDGIKFAFCDFMCEIRKCVIAKGFDTCADCPSKVTCEKLSPITDSNENARKNVGLCDIMQTDRIYLRRWLDSDAERLFALASDPDVGPRAGWEPHKNVEESRQIIKDIFGGETMWAVVLKDTDSIVGCVGYLDYQFSNIPIKEDEAEIGYWIGKEYWNQGICTEALKLIIDYCKNVKGMSAFWGDHFLDNPASGKVMTKCGFIDTGIRTKCETLDIGSDKEVAVLKLSLK